MAFTISGISGITGLNLTTTQPLPFLSGLFAWGQGANGKLGLGDTTSRSSPNQVGSLTNWATLAAGGGSSYGITTGGAIWAWGKNNKGQLGLGDTTNRSSPVQIGALTNWLNIAAGYEHSLAIKTNGTLWSWGNGDKGKLGLSVGPAVYYSSPKQVGENANWSVLGAGRTHIIAFAS